ncbi:MAG TPA: NfeD family protein, partial [Hyphomonas sp.]|nr:NfeD family protein [Hyphomonas sp.]
MEQVFSELTFWHWLALGLILFGIEMMSGTFDLLMVSIAAWLTAAFTYFAPDSLSGWQGQMIV